MKGIQAYWVSLALFAAALLLAFDPWPFVSPLSALAKTPPWATDPAPVRKVSPRPAYVVAGFTYACSDCHRVIAAVAQGSRMPMQHKEIELKHGINTRCLNCHHPTNRDVFVDDFGNAIPWDQPQLLCAKCHGPVYRDWQHGAHGRLNGYWDKNRGPQTRRRCVECHDPHAPPFPSLKPAPGPRTLRTGPDSPHRVSPLNAHEPLRIYSAEPADSAEH